MFLQLTYYYMFIYSCTILKYTTSPVPRILRYLGSAEFRNGFKELVGLPGYDMLSDREIRVSSFN